MIEAALHSVLQEGVSGNKAAVNSQETKMVIQLKVKKMRVVVPVLRRRMRFLEKVFLEAVLRMVNVRVSIHF